MEEYVKTAELDNEVEAQFIGAVLEENGIPYIIRSYRDLAYDGLFQFHRGWGFISVPDFYQEKALNILRDIRKEGYCQNLD